MKMNTISSSIATRVQLVAAALLLAVGVAAFIGFRLGQTFGFFMKPFNYHAAEVFVDKLPSMNRTINIEHAVALPNELGDQLADKFVYISNVSTGTICYLFISIRGKGQNMQGFLYSPFSLLPIGSTLVLTYPDYSQSGPCRKATVTVNSAVRAGWFQVSCDMD